MAGYWYTGTFIVLIMQLHLISLYAIRRQIRVSTLSTRITGVDKVELNEAEYKRATSAREDSENEYILN
jgi:hypothetical protein